MKETVRIRLLSIVSVVSLHGAGLYAALSAEPPVQKPSLILRASIIPGSGTAPENPGEKAERKRPAPPEKPQRKAPAESRKMAAQTTEAPAPSSETETVAAPETEASEESQGGAVTEPQFQADYLQNPSPSYPSLSRRLREEGRVVLRVYVDEAGNPGEVLIHQSSGFERLDQSAQDTVKKWKFIPARNGSRQIGAWVLVPVAFSLRS